MVDPVSLPLTEAVTLGLAVPVPWGAGGQPCQRGLLSHSGCLPVQQVAAMTSGLLPLVVLPVKELEFPLLHLEPLVLLIFF